MALKKLGQRLYNGGAAGGTLADSTKVFDMGTLCGICWEDVFRFRMLHFRNDG